MWLLSYLKMLTRQDSYNCVPAIKYLPLLSHRRGQEAFKFVTAETGGAQKQG